MITTKELDYIRSAAIGDMIGDSKELDELEPGSYHFQAVPGTGTCPE